MLINTTDTLIPGIRTMFEYDFMINAFAAAGIVAVLAGIVGYFLVLRGQTFAGHALSHVGFTGATGAVLLGISPIWGMVGFTLAAGIGMGALGERLAGRDVAIGVILSGALGFGLLFLHFYTSFATQVTALLFGNVLAVSRDTLAALAGIGAVSLVALALIARPLLFASLQPELAEAKGVSLRTVSVLFLAVCALAVAAATQIVGVLLVFTLLVGRRRPRRTCRRGCRPACCSPRCSRCSKRGSASRSRITPTGRRASGSRPCPRSCTARACCGGIERRATRRATPACRRACRRFLMRHARATCGARRRSRSGDEAHGFSTRA